MYHSMYKGAKIQSMTTKFHFHYLYLLKLDISMCMSTDIEFEDTYLFSHSPHVFKSTTTTNKYVLYSSNNSIRSEDVQMFVLISKIEGVPL